MRDGRPPRVSPALRRALIQRWLLVGGLVVLLIGSALLWPRDAGGGLAVPTATAPPAEGGVLRGALRAQQEDGTVCFRVEGPGGDVLLLLPRGWTADARLGLRDPSGVVVAQPGDGVDATGGPGGARPAACPGSGRTWTVGRLSRT